MIPRIWKISPGEKGMHWDEFLRDSCVAVGDWEATGLGDISRFNRPEELTRKIVEQYNLHKKKKGTKGKNQAATIATKQLLLFYNDIQENHIIVAYSKKHIIGIGKVTGSYYHIEDSKYFDGDNYCKKMEWKKLKTPIDISSYNRIYKIFKQNKTITKIRPDYWNYLIDRHPEIKTLVDSLN